MIVFVFWNMVLSLCSGSHDEVILCMSSIPPWPCPRQCAEEWLMFVGNTKAHKWCQAGSWLSGATSLAPFPILSKYSGIFSGYRILPINARNVFFEYACARYQSPFLRPLKSGLRLHFSISTESWQCCYRVLSDRAVWGSASTGSL